MYYRYSVDLHFVQKLIIDGKVIVWQIAGFKVLR